MWELRKKKKTDVEAEKQAPEGFPIINAHRALASDKDVTRLGHDVGGTNRCPKRNSDEYWWFYLSSPIDKS